MWLVARVMASHGNSDSTEVQRENECLEREKCISELLDDSEARELMIWRLEWSCGEWTGDKRGGNDDVFLASEKCRWWQFMAVIFNAVSLCHAISPFWGL